MHYPVWHISLWKRTKIVNEEVINMAVPVRAWEEQASTCRDLHHNIDDGKQVAILSTSSSSSLSPLASINSSILCRRSSVFACIFGQKEEGTMMVESRTNQLVLNSNNECRDEDVLAFLSFLEYGHPFFYFFIQESPEFFDAGAVWLLAHKWDVDGIKEWIIEHGINHDNIIPAMNFMWRVASPEVVLPDGGDSLSRAIGRCMWTIQPSMIPRESFSGGVCFHAMEHLVQCFLDNYSDPVDIFQLIMQWWNHEDTSETCRNSFEFEPLLLRKLRKKKRPFHFSEFDFMKNKK